ncbi:MAG: AbrB/MazE/SpoVT family DNA-binding domain-containing protein [Nanoarchaeota archaeon]
MNIELTKMSSKGQVVIPGNIREKLELSEGEILAVSSKDNMIVLKKIENPTEEEDLRTFSEIKKSWKEISEGKFKKMKSEDFLKEISKW